MSDEPVYDRVSEEVEDETEVVPHSEEDTEEQLPWCVGCMG